MKLAASASWGASRRLEKLWQRIVAEFHTERPLLLSKWKWILAGIFFQYVHGVATRSAHYFHNPAPLPHDMGYALIPEIGKERGVISEWLFLVIFLPFCIWTFTPFVCRDKKFYTCLIWVKTLVTLSICQFFRILSFTATQLPGPNYHCRVGSPLATIPPPKSVLELLRLNVMFGCGDLIFSSHMTFTLVCVLTYTKYGQIRLVKAFGWILLVAQSLLIIAARKHYTVDVVIAWYVVPLVFFFVERKLNESIISSPTEIVEWSPRQKAVLPQTLSDNLPPPQPRSAKGSLPHIVMHVAVEPCDAATNGGSPVVLRAIQPTDTPAAPNAGEYRGVLIMWEGRSVAIPGSKPAQK